MAVRARIGERAVLVLSLVHALLVLAWYGLRAADHDAMWGAYLGLGVAGVMTLSAVADLARHPRGDRRELRAHAALARAAAARLLQ